jgi:hypothetical protein
MRKSLNKNIFFEEEDTETRNIDDDYMDYINQEINDMKKNYE